MRSRGRKIQCAMQRVLPDAVADVAPTWRRTARLESEDRKASDKLAKNKAVVSHCDPS